MKKITKYFSSLMLAALLTNVTFAQTSDAKQDQPYPRILEDKATSERLQKDWKKRNATIQSQSVQWFEIGDGYYGSYTQDNNKYMTLYDLDGNYIKTYKKVDWSTVPATASIKSTYDLSNYKSQKVTSYWEATDPDLKGYYFEITDDQGKVSRVWANETGEFSTVVPKPKTKF
jgi:hypothetical protein